MPAEPSFLSLPIHLDRANECLWRRSQVIAPRPKTFAPLRCLVDHPGQLPTKGSLFDAVWPGTAVSDGVLTVCIRGRRQAADNALRRYANADEVSTSHRGYMPATMAHM